MPSLGELDPALATVLLLTLNGLVPLPRAAVCIPAGAALGWAAMGPSMLGTAIGLGLGFSIARFALRAPVERFARERPRFSAVMRAIDQEGWRLLALLRLGSPVPGPAINTACGVTRMGFWTFLLVSVVAVLPQTLLFVYLGRAGSEALASRSLFSLDTLTAVTGVVVTLFALWRISVVAKRQSARVLVEVRRKDEATGRGSGFCVTEGLRMSADPHSHEVAFTPTLDDALRSQRLALPSVWWRFGFGTAACGLVAAAVAATSREFSVPAVALIGVVGGLLYLACLAIVWRLWFPRRVAKLYRQQASLQHAYVVTWDEHGLRAVTDQASTFVRWADYVKRRENEAIILLYQSDAMMQFLPKCAFTEPQMGSLRPHLDRVRLG